MNPVYSGRTGFGYTSTSSYDGAGVTDDVSYSRTPFGVPMNMVLLLGFTQIDRIWSVGKTLFEVLFQNTILEKLNVIQ